MNKQSGERPVRVGLIALGCAKNLVDAEIMLGTLLKEGIELTNEAGQADVLIVNTCSFIDSAQEESVDAILESAELREKTRPHQAVVVAGCLSQRFRQELPQLLPEVDAFMGVDQVPEIGRIIRQALGQRRAKLSSPQPRAGGKPVRRSRERTAVMENLAALSAKAPAPAESKGESAIQDQRVLRPSSPPLLEVNLRPQYIPDYATPRFRLTPSHFAYVKIAEGCNHPCSFCIIPRMRGSHRSRQQADIVAEARALIADGVKEINLISQDSTYYGVDLRPNHTRAIAGPERFKAVMQSLPENATTLSSLLRELNSLEGDFWIRLLYTHPAHWTDELISTITACPKVARYVDIPLQHIHENMLERMRRETSRHHIAELLHRLRTSIPGIALRTTFIVGFPGETESCFESLLDFIRETRFERLGVFTYSREEGTRAAGMAGQLPEKMKQRRRERAMEVQHQVAVSVAEACVGRTLRVLVEKEAGARELQNAKIRSWEHGLVRSQDLHAGDLLGKYLVARGEADAPDIDGRVYIRGHLPAGRFARVEVIGHTDYDLIAEPVPGF